MMIWNIILQLISLIIMTQQKTGAHCSTIDAQLAAIYNEGILQFLQDLATNHLALSGDF